MGQGISLKSERKNSWFNPWFSFHFSSLSPAPYIELYVCYWISYLNFRAVLVLPKTAGSAQTHKSMSFVWIVWSTLYVYLWYVLWCCGSICHQLFTFIQIASGQRHFWNNYSFIFLDSTVFGWQVEIHQVNFWSADLRKALQSSQSCLAKSIKIGVDKCELS